MPNDLPSPAGGAEVLGGSSEAADLEAWITAYGPSVLHFAASRVSIRSDAEDIFQEVFVRACRARSSLRDPTKVKAWLLSMTANLCRDRTRWHYRQRRHLSPEDLPDVEDPRADTAGRVLAGEDRARLWSQVMALPEQSRDVIILHYLEELSIRQTAEVLTCSERAVKTRLHRARNRLRQVLQEEDEGNA